MHAVSPCCSHCQHLNSRLSCAQGPLQAVLRIRIRTDPYYMAGSVSDDTDPGSAKNLPKPIKKMSLKIIYEEKKFKE